MGFSPCIATHDVSMQALFNLIQSFLMILHVPLSLTSCRIRAPIKVKRVVEKVEKLKWKCLQYIAASQW
ncbi:hypothetical protein CMV_008065 [Castanea mollissima]|uniref:Uncharacterized protein n=1 Tax=Castanea mollissima TaxID=60419 RepID=A0A8J4RGY7_9ROSI|nr:hypothetical protein CMV_008065 [Castanea mollissima]